MAILIGKGNTAEVYEYSDGKALKLFYKGYPMEAVRREYHNAVVLSEAELPAPIAHGIITDENGRCGIVYDRLRGHSLLQQITEEPFDAAWIERFAGLHKRLLSHHTTKVDSFQDFLRGLCRSKETLETELLQKIEELPKGECLCHGDFHPGNVWVNEDGTLEVLDFMNVCCGPWQYDVARTYFLISMGQIPNDVPNKEALLTMQRQLADLYLEYMKVEKEELCLYLEVIEKCRKYEA